MKMPYLPKLVLALLLTATWTNVKAQLFKDAFYLSVGYGLVVDPPRTSNVPLFDLETSQTRPVVFMAELPTSKAFSLGLLVSYDKLNMSVRGGGVSSEALVKRYYFLFRGTYYTRCIGDSFCPYVGLDLGGKSLNSQFKSSSGGVDLLDFGFNMGFGPAFGVHGGAKLFLDSFFLQVEINPPVAYLHASVGYEF